MRLGASGSYQPHGSLHSPHCRLGRSACQTPTSYKLIRHPSYRRSWIASAGDADATGGSNNINRNGFSSLGSIDDMDKPENFCIIESRDTVKDFEQLALSDLRSALSARRNRIFLLMEEVRRLRIQLRTKGADSDKSQEMQEERFMSAVPYLPPLTPDTLKTYYAVYFFLFCCIIAFGGLVAPILELKLGVGGTSYSDFVQNVGLPIQLAAVDPIVASFCGGSVGVLSSLLVVEINNIKKQQRNRCHYCEGTGYLSCGQCIGTGLENAEAAVAMAGASSSSGSSSSNGSGGLIVMKAGVPGSVRTLVGRACPLCSGSGKVMCTGCLCTGKQMATEHDPRIDPFD